MKKHLEKHTNKDKHHDKIFRQVQKIRSKNPQISTSAYLHDLFDYFHEDLRSIINQIYDDFVLINERFCPKIKATELQNIIDDLTECLIPNYKRILQSYNMGGMFRENENANGDINTFLIEIEEERLIQSRLTAEKYREYIKKKRFEFWTLIASVVAAITGVLALYFSTHP